MIVVLTVLILGAPSLRLSATGRASGDVGTNVSFADRQGAQLRLDLGADATWNDGSSLRLVYSPQLQTMHYNTTGSTRPIVFHTGSVAGRYPVDQRTTLTVTGGASYGELDVQVANRQLATTSGSALVTSPLTGSTISYYSLDARANLDRTFTQRLTGGVGVGAYRLSPIDYVGRSFTGGDRIDADARAQYALTQVHTLGGSLTFSRQGYDSRNVYYTSQLAVTYAGRLDPVDVTARAGGMVAHVSRSNSYSHQLTDNSTPVEVPPIISSSWTALPLVEASAATLLLRGFNGELALKALAGVGPYFDLLQADLATRSRTSVGLVAKRYELTSGLAVEWSHALGSIGTGAARDTLIGTANVAYRVSSMVSIDVGASLITYPSIPGSRRDLLVTFGVIGVTDMKSGG